jgi:hypothetical protein
MDYQKRLPPGFIEIGGGSVVISDHIRYTFQNLCASTTLPLLRGNLNNR